MFLLAPKKANTVPITIKIANTNVTATTIRPKTISIVPPMESLIICPTALLFDCTNATIVSIKALISQATP